MKCTLSQLAVAAVTGLMVALPAGASPAADETVALSVSAGDAARQDTPVCVTLEVPADARSVELTDAAGDRIPAQLTAPGLLNAAGPEMRELHFILPKLAKGESLSLTARFSPEAPAGGGFAWQSEPGKYVELKCGGRPVVRYMCRPPDPADAAVLEETYKVYHHLYNPAGTQLITKGPGGMYPHHRGLFFGYCNVGYGDGKKANTWSGKATPEVHTGFVREEAGPVLGRHLASIEWRGSDGKPYLKEQRQVTVYQLPGGYVVDWASRSVPTDGKVRLDGNAPHAGFHFRAAQEVAELTTKDTYYVRPDGKGETGQAVASAKSLPWDAISFVVGGNRYTVVYLDRPDNPKPVEYNERTYGRFGSFFPYDLVEGKDLSISYRVFVQDGETTVERCAAMSADFVEPPKVQVK